jgi:hypothetical protein
LVDRFGSNLSKDKVNLLNSTNYVIESELVHFKTGIEIQGKILRDMLRSIIHIKCVKEITLDNGNTTNIIYGEDIENDIIEFYAANIADRYKFGINSNNKSLTLAFELMDAFGPKFDNIMLNNNVNQILAMNEAALFASNYNNDVNYSNSNITTNENVNIMDFVNNSPVEETSSGSILSEDEYKNLCMKFARNESLTPEEYNKLLMATPDLMDNNEINKFKEQDTLLEEQEIKSRGFTISSLSTYFIIITMLLLMIFGFLVF